MQSSDIFEKRQVPLTSTVHKKPHAKQLFTTPTMQIMSPANKYAFFNTPELITNLEFFVEF